MSTIEFTDQRANARSAPVTRALTQAALAAGGAPAVLGCRPWQWQVGDGTLRLGRGEGSDLCITDPNRRLATVGRGAALRPVILAAATRRLVAAPVTESVLPAAAGRRTAFGCAVAAVHVAAPVIPALTARPPTAHADDEWR